MTFSGLDFNNVKSISASSTIDKDAIKDGLLVNIHNVLSYLLPSGKFKGSHYVIGDIDGNKGGSMKVSLYGEDAGLYYDHHTGDSGDILKLWAIKHNLCPTNQFDEILKTASQWQGNYSHIAPSYSSQIKEYEDLGAYTDRYDYHSIQGEINNCVYRYDTPEGKQFRPYNIKTGQWKAPIPRPLYNLPNIAQCEHIILCEGEKCADALISVGYCATTAMGGANTPLDKTDWLPLKGKHIWIWADNDKAGYDYAKRVSKHLKTICVSVTQLNPPTNKPEKWDAADAVAEGINIPEYIKIHTPIIHSVTKPFQAYKIGTLFNDTSPMPEDIIFPRLLTEGGFLLFGGAPKVGKTDFLMSLLVRMGLGQEFLGFKPKRALKIFYLQAEIGYHYLRERFNKLSLTDEEKALLADNLVVTDHFKMRLDDEGIKHTAEMILEHFPDGDVDIICIDPFYNVFDGGANNASENDNQAVFDFLQNKLCKLRDMINPKAGIILSHHTKKIDKKTLEADPFQAFSGASSLRRFYSSGMVMYYPEGSKTHRRIEFELRHGEGIPPKTVIKSNGQWCEIDPISERIVNQKYGAKLDKERMRKQDVILEIIDAQAKEGKVFTSTQFCQAFEGKLDLGGKDAIRSRIDVLTTKGYIQFFKNGEAYNLPAIGRSKFGMMCVENMEIKVAEGDDFKYVTVYPTHYKCPSTGASLPVRNPTEWVYEMEDLGDDI